MHAGSEQRRTSSTSAWVVKTILAAAVAAIVGGAGIVLGRTERVPLLEHRLDAIETTLTKVNEKLDLLFERR